MGTINDQIAELAGEHRWNAIWKANEPQLILLGEEHEDESSQVQQDEVIRIVKPQIVLYECANTTEYDPKTGELKGVGENMRFLQYRLYLNKLILAETYPEERETVKGPLYADKGFGHGYRLSDELGFLVKGCDLPFDEQDEIMQQLKKDHPSASYKERLHMMAPLREKEMGRIILENLPLTDGVIVGIFGADHIRNIDSPLHKKLQGSQVQYSCYDQVPGVR